MMALLLLAAQSAANCANPQTQLEMTTCAGQDFQKADAALNAQWKRTAARMKALDVDPVKDGRPSYSQALLVAQRAWLAYRDAHCRSAGYYARGGSMEPMLVATCRAELTRERARQLKELTAE
jgi:uncharacterized protein YecT (DUF1311 family)